MSLGSCSQGALYITTQKVPYRSGATAPSKMLDFGFEQKLYNGLFSWTAVAPLEIVLVPGEVDEKIDSLVENK